MGKGDKKSTRGKIWRGSYGNTRPHRVAHKKSAAQSAVDSRKGRRK
ncbi:MAG: 30S ribosomal protein THX [Gammaproteobacteria bacterium]|nr:30S ribosomal protein THX [Gammaproteobacteria bacterium]MBU6509476.1 30S ribosomal protein THX [Gammaproteobacteria bacterium]MDE1984030.1 30S ribosomal protein THX [Gammaproteobacteria bacterium]